VLQSLKIAAIAILVGLIFSVAYNGVAIALCRHFDPYGQGALSNILFAPGLLLAGPGFEAQAAVLPANVLAFWIAAAIAVWLVLRRRARRLAGEVSSNGWWPDQK